MTRIREQAGQAQRPPRADRSEPLQLVIAPARGWSALRLGEIWEYRDLLWFMTWRDLQARYRQMAFGPLWIVLQPVLSMVIYTVIFGNIARLPTEGQPYAVFTFAALLPWGVFADAVNGAANSLLANRALMNKVYFPRLLFPVSKVIISLIDFGIAFVILIGMLVAYGIEPNWAGLWVLPVLLGLAVFTGLGVGLWFSGITVQYRDFGQLLGIVMRFWMYATPVVYAAEVIEQRLGEPWATILRLNPMTMVVEGFRWALLRTEWHLGNEVGISLAVFLVVMIGGLFVFRRVERTIVDIA
jgi:lipopolysaccharide transport system permease protein